MAYMRRVNTMPVEIEPEEIHPYGELVRGLLRQRQRALVPAMAELEDDASLAEAADTLVTALQRGNKVLVAGNGGSAAEAQHLAAELVGRFKRNRDPFAAMALCTDSSIITAVSNDYGYEQVFARQVAALGCPGDVFIAFSTSGESENLVRAVATARQRGLQVIVVTGARACRMEQFADITIHPPVTETELVQELHMVVTHVLCTIVENVLTSKDEV